MTGEQFHDALTLLPADLIAQADKIRCRKPKVLPWKRYAALAACLAAVLCSAMAYRSFQQKNANTEMAAAAPFDAMQEEAVDSGEAPLAAAGQAAPKAAAPDAAAGSADGNLCIETPINRDCAEDRQGTTAALLTSPEELDAYLAEWDTLYQLDALRDACSSYDGDWFASHDLLLIPVDDVSAGQTCVVTEVSCANGGCDITVAITGEETAKRTNCHIAVPVAKGTVSDAGQIILHFA